MLLKRSSLIVLGILCLFICTLMARAQTNTKGKLNVVIQTYDGQSMDGVEKIFKPLAKQLGLTDIHIDWISYERKPEVDCRNNTILYLTPLKYLSLKEELNPSLIPLLLDEH